MKKYFIYRNSIQKNIALFRRIDERYVAFVKYLHQVSPGALTKNKPILLSIIHNDIVAESDSYEEILGLGALESLS